MMSGRLLPQFSTGALFLLLAWSSLLVNAEISNGFSSCTNFFYKGTPPKGFDGAEYKQICQRLQNQYRFATLYDQTHRVAVYSAYTLNPAAGKRQDETWYYEPQVSRNTTQKEMISTDLVKEDEYKDSQAVERDYRGTLYTKGHLNPSMHHATVEDRDATFTLTNMVPQRGGSNSGTWNDYEKELVDKYSKYCNGEMYVITGALPFEVVRNLQTDRVSIPEYLWSAYCCPSYKDKSPVSEFPSYAVVGRNDPNSGNNIVPVDQNVKGDRHGYDSRKMTLTQLEELLRSRLRMNNIQLFNGDCKVNK
uniref:Endonuclease domain-containing 1 protein-like n=1 Tax=Cynoglossus semilaevis TaxID=244447 RepID=A0A3P8VAQ8_CYNSE